MGHGVADDPKIAWRVAHTTILSSLIFSRTSTIFQNAKKIVILPYEINEETSEVEKFFSDFRDNLRYGSRGGSKNYRMIFFKVT